MDVVEFSLDWLEGIGIAVGVAVIFTSPAWGLALFVVWRIRQRKEA